jgi:hypothetical protein
MVRAKKVIERFSRVITAQFAIIGLGAGRTHRLAAELFPLSIEDALELKVSDASTKPPTKSPHELVDSWGEDKSLAVQAKVTSKEKLNSDNQVEFISKRIYWDPEFNNQTSEKTVGEYALGIWNQKVKDCKEIFDECRFIGLLWPNELKDSTLEEGTLLEFTYFKHEFPEFDASKMEWTWGQSGESVVWGHLDGVKVFISQRSGGQTKVRFELPDDAIRFSIPYNTTLLDLDTIEFDEDTIVYLDE